MNIKHVEITTSADVHVPLDIQEFTLERTHTNIRNGATPLGSSPFIEHTTKSIIG